jgi:hypothetical protein
MLRTEFESATEVFERHECIHAHYEQVDKVLFFIRKGLKR